ncbi:MAG: hypothetical protein H6R07_1748 [Proteobacteria bacterium]|nr:hypothetical protein [Pseudomonadota bacterium]
MEKRIYQKTLRGTNEINHRSNAISARLRRLLIVIDGRKDVGELRQLVPLDDMHEALDQLETLRLIERHQPTLSDLISNDVHQIKQSPKGMEEQFWGAV